MSCQSGLLVSKLKKILIFALVIICLLWLKNYNCIHRVRPCCVLGELYSCFKRITRLHILSYYSLSYHIVSDPNHSKIRTTTPNDRLIVYIWPNKSKTTKRWWIGFAMIMVINIAYIWFGPHKQNIYQRKLITFSFKYTDHGGSSGRWGPYGPAP